MVFFLISNGQFKIYNLQDRLLFLLLVYLKSISFGVKLQPLKLFCVNLLLLLAINTVQNFESPFLCFFRNKKGKLQFILVSKQLTMQQWSWICNIILTKKIISCHLSLQQEVDLEFTNCQCIAENIKVTFGEKKIQTK